MHSPIPYFLTALIVVVLNYASVQNYPYQDANLRFRNNDKTHYETRLSSDEDEASDVDARESREPNATNVNATLSDNYTSQQLVLPNVMIIGAAKAGTTSIAQWLLHQNDVCGGKVFPGEPSHYWKEVHYFDFRYNKGVDFYSKRFEHCIEDGSELIGDATPGYLSFPERVYDTYTDPKVSADQLSALKLIVVLREPVARELSWYNHKVSMVLSSRANWVHNNVVYTNGTVKSFDVYAAELRRNFTMNPDLAYGFYVDHLRTWVELFGRKQLLVLSYSELLQDPEKVQWRIEEFLAAKFVGSLGVSNTRSSPHKVKSISLKALEVLQPLFQPKNDELYEFLRSRPGPSMEQHPFPVFDSVDVK